MLFTPRKKGISTENFIRLQDGQEVTGIFAGMPDTFKIHWLNNKTSICEDGCSVCRDFPDNKPKFRFRINLVTQENGKWIPKIFEGGGPLFDDLVAKDAKFGLHKTLIEISRRGTKADTKYEVLPRLDIVVTPEMIKEIKTVKLHVLTQQKEA